MNFKYQTIECTAPVRICDIGGWTDTWFARQGAVFNIGVTPVVNVTIRIGPQDREDRVSLILRNFNESYRLNPDIIHFSRHPLIEAAIDMMKVPPGIDVSIDIASDVPSGASVGTSAAVCVALTGALDALTTGRLSTHNIASLAHRVETEKLGLQSGIQDQLCSAYGGINYIYMHEFPHSTVIPVKTGKKFLRELEQRLVLIYIGTPHKSSEVHKMVIDSLGENASSDPRLERLRQLAAEARNAVIHENFQELGRVMNENTETQRLLHPGLVCSRFEELIDIAGKFGVLGCKVNGAGGDGGSVTILTDGQRDKKQKLIDCLLACGFHFIPIALSSHGVHVKERILNWK